jgi:hypothetical protein
VKEKGEVFTEDWSTDPAPFSVIVTLVALAKVLFATVTAVMPQVLPLEALRITDGSLMHPHDTAKLFPRVMQPSLFLTAIRWFPFATSTNEVPGWKAPPSRLYWYPAPTGLSIVITACPNPRAHSTVYVGSAGEAGWGLITRGDEGTDVHNASLVTVKVYVPGSRPDTVIDDPLPDVVTFPGLRVSTQIPEGGREFNTTLPVARIQVGWVMFPITGADGVAGCAFITAFDDGAEVQPVEFVTVKVYVPGDIPEITVDNVLPKTVLPPGLIVTVHDPAGNPFRVTLPVASAQVGWVINPTTGAEGAEGAAGIVTLDEGDDVHPPWFVTV